MVSEEIPTHEVVRSSFVRFENGDRVAYQQGDRLVPTETELTNFDTWFVEMETEEVDEMTEEEQSSTESVDSEFDAEQEVESNAKPLASSINSGEFDAHLDAIHDAEKSRSKGPRKTVIGALEDRIDELGL